MPASDRLPWNVAASALKGQDCFGDAGNVRGN